MPANVKGFPPRFPVAGVESRSWRYRAAALACRVFFRSLFGRHLRIEGEENIPGHGPLLLVSNHLSAIDPLLFGGFFPKTLFALAKQEIFANRFWAWFFAGCNCIPVNRGGADRWAISQALSVLNRHGRLLIFVEGTRSRSASMKAVQPGVAFLARRSGATILPVALFGTESCLAPGRILPRRVPVTIRYGKPLQAEAHWGRDDVADGIGRAIAALLPAEYRGHYAPPGDQAARN